jgi:hypothetical protein
MAEVLSLIPHGGINAASSILAWDVMEYSPEVTWIESTDAIFSNYVLHPCRLCYSRMESLPKRRERAAELLKAHIAPLVRWNDT